MLNNDFIFFHNCEGIDIDKYILKKKFYGELAYFSDNNMFGNRINYDDEEGNSLFFDGYVTNEEELQQDIKSFIIGRNLINDCFWDMLRGGFCGFKFNNSHSVTMFVDHVGIRNLYYCYDGTALFISNNISLIVESLKRINKSILVGESAIQNLLEFGFIIDDSTMVEGIKRVLPGTNVTIDFNSNNVVTQQYYHIRNDAVDDAVDHCDYIDGVDFYFRKAIHRQFQLDKNSGYKHIVELSGGLDSRMVAIVANEMGYDKQMNVICTARNHLDWLIAHSIARDYDNDILEYDMMDCRWINDFRKSLKSSCWTESFFNVAHMYHCYNLLSAFDQYGMSHTGTMGDALLSTVYTNETINYLPPTGKENAYSQKVNYNKNYPSFIDNNESFTLNITGLIGVNGANHWKNHFMEWGSPFLDVDFIDYVMRIPFKYRNKHKIYLDWIRNYYPKALNYGYEKWGGLKPTRKGEQLWNNSPHYKPFTMENEYENYCNNLYYDYVCGLQVNYSDYICNTIKSDIDKLLATGSFHEKCMAVSVLEAIKQIVDL